MGDTFPLWPVGASTISGTVDALFIFLTLLSLVMTVAIFATVLVFATKYRRRPHVEAVQIEGSTLLELGWSIIPLGIFMVIFACESVLKAKDLLMSRQSGVFAADIAAYILKMSKFVRE